MAQNEVRIGADSLQEFAREVFIRTGLPAKDAETEAKVLIWANLRGVDSHGVLRIPMYVEFLASGVMNAKPKVRIEKETPATLLIEADRAMGPVATVFAMEKTIEKARKVGIGWTLIRNVTHQGAIGYYSLMAADSGMAGITIATHPPNTAPFGAKAAGVHNSPIAIAVPAKRHYPLVLDMATSVVAGGKIDLAKDKGVPLGNGWALDKDGNPTTDPNKAAILLPSAGPKGSGLAFMFECLTGVMVGNPLLEPALFGKKSHHIQNSLVAAVNINNFTELENYKVHIDALIDGIKALPKAEGFTEIFVPGEPEARTAEERRKNGIPLPQGTVHNLRNVAGKLGVKLPPGL